MSKANPSGQVVSEPGSMSSTLVHNAYGKSRVRLSKITRHADRHDFKELSIDIQIEGDFEASYLKGDNSSVVATDSMKNTVYILASEHPLTSIESFGKALCEHFLKTYKQMHSVRVDIWEDHWQRINADGKPHPHSFFGAGNEQRTARIQLSKDGLKIESGLEGLCVVKTTASEWCDFVRDEYTTLPEAKDRIFGTSIAARWHYRRNDCDYNRCYEQVRQIILEVFAEQYSLSVQHTLNAIGDAVLKKVNEIETITLTMPNQHRIAFDLSRFGKENRNEIFVNTDEPYGLITGTVTRKT